MKLSNISLPLGDIPLLLYPRFRFVLCQLKATIVFVCCYVVGYSCMQHYFNVDAIQRRFFTTGSASFKEYLRERSGAQDTCASFKWQCGVCHPYALSHRL